MLGSRTKKVNCYGKRNQRIVTSAEKKNIFSPFNDADMADSVSSPVKPSLNHRENAVNPVVKTRKVSSPKVVIPARKRSPIANPALKLRKTAVAERPLITAVFKSLSTQNDSPFTTPLGALHPNVPGSPALPGKPRRKHISPLARGLTKPFSPFTEMEIRTIDDDGHTITKETRRVSHISRDTDDSDGEAPGIVKPPRRLKSRAIVVSDDSDSDSDDEVPLPLEPPRMAPLVALKAALSPPSKPLPVAAIDLTAESPLAHCTPPKSSRSRPTKSSQEIAYIDLTVDTAYVAKPRQLTPVRPGRNRLFAPPSPPSPCLTAELDEFSDLSLYDPDLNDHDVEIPEVPQYLAPLLAECDQVVTHDFSSFISAFPHDPILFRTASSSLSRFRKVGEASYSEVFGIGDVVLKIIPLRDEAPSPATPHQRDEREAPAPTDARDVLKEIIVTRAMGAVHEGFVTLLKAYIVKGRYPQELLELWDEYNDRKGSESIRPDTFSLSQVYAIIVLPNGGPDLESYVFKTPTKMGWRQAASIFWQVTRSLSHAEQLVSFEHRDLHWGQVLVKDLPMQTTPPLQAHSQNKKVTKAEHVPMDDQAHGVQVTLIDLGLSRMDAGDGAGGEMVHWTPFDAEVFEGEGDYQYDIYRMMRDQNRGNWEAFKPLTNVMWLHYLLVQLLKSKGIKAPRKNAAASAQAGHSERECYDCLVDLERWLGQCLVAAAARVNKPVVKGKGRRKTAAPVVMDDVSLSPICAGEVVEYGIKKKWIKAISG